MVVGDWDRRQLCPDGACIGVIGGDGTCKVCGRAAPNWGEERKRGLVEPNGARDGDGDDDDDDDDVAAKDPVAPSAPAKIGVSEWDRRQVCPDGACIGVIDHDGKCKVCGKRADARADEDDEEEDDDDHEDDERSDEEVDDEDENDEDENDENDEDDDEDDEDEDEDEDDELAAAAEGMAGIATAKEVATADQLAAKSSDDDRKLCPDGACIGLIGDDGKCKVCGKEAA